MLRRTQRLATLAVSRPSRQAQRLLWTEATTLVSTSPHALVRHFDSLPRPTSSPISSFGAGSNITTVYAISKNIPIELVQLLRATLDSTSSTPYLTTTTTPSASSSIGCLSEVLPNNALPPSLANTLQGELYSISTATFTSDNGSRAVPFRSTLTGRPNISLGREIKVDLTADATDVVDHGFEAFLSGKKWGFGDNSTKGSKEVLDDLAGIPAEEVKQLVCMTADRAQPFLSSISAFTSSSTLGLVASSTPFHTTAHTPYSLFYNGQTLESGAVGVAIVGGEPAKSTEIDYVGMETLGEPMQVTSSKGNIVLTLDSQNAARLLLTAVQKLNLTPEEKDRPFFAALFENPPGPTPDLSKARIVSRIMAGDPSRGAMSVDTEEDVKQGYYLSFLHLPTSPRSHLLSDSLPKTFAFMSIPPSYTNFKHDPVEGKVVTLDGFIAASENGVVLSRLGLDSWVNKNEGVVVTLPK